MPYAVIDYAHWRFVNDGDPLAQGETLMDALPDPDAEQRFADYVSMVADGVTAWLSGYVNKNLSYDDIVSAASYAGDKNPKFNAEGTAARDWRSDCFIALYAAVPTYSAMSPDQWPTLDYITANLPQPSAYQWEPS